MSEQDLQLMFEFPAGTEAAVREVPIAAPVDGSLLEGTAEESAVPFLFQETVSGTPEEPQDESSEEETEPSMTHSELQRAALAWLASMRPTAAALRVPTRLARFRADAAAFWSSPGRHRLLQPNQTIIVEGRLTRAECWPECSDSDAILPSYRNLQERRLELEETIRRTEPRLLDSDVLFPEVEYWNYAGTANPEYPQCMAKLAEFESALYRGSRFERIREGAVANELYLAVPEGLVEPNELAEGWGLLYVHADLSIEQIRPAFHFQCPKENMLHLSQNIAASSLRDVLFAHGIFQEEDGAISFRRLPKLRSRILPGTDL